MSACPSIFELRHFVGAGESSPDFDAHVSHCEACRATLSRLARTALGARGLLGELSLPSRSTALPAFIALAACLAVMLGHPSPAAARAATVVSSPEGIHGVPPTELEAPAVTLSGLTDAGASRSGD